MRVILTALLLFFAAPAVAQFALSSVTNSLVDFVLDQISAPGELELAAEGVEGSEDGALDIIGLTASDADGVWLRIDRLSISWNAARILRGELEINRFVASGVTVSRAPNAAAVDVEVKDGSALDQTDGDLFDWPRSPLTTRIERLALVGVKIAPNVIAASGLSFDAEGSAADEGDLQSVRLNVMRTDEIAGDISLEYLRDFAANELTLKLSADEAAGGLVAELADFPADAASRITVDGQGPLNDWSLVFDAQSDGVFMAIGDARINAVQKIAATATFAFTPGAALGDEVRAALSPSARLDVDIAEADGGVVEIRQAVIGARDIDLTFAGDFDRSTSTLGLSAELDVRSGLSRLIDGVFFESASFVGTLEGPLDRLAAQGRLGLTGFRSAAVDLEDASLEASVLLNAHVIDADIDGGVLGLRLDQIQPDLIGEAKIAAKVRYGGDSASISLFEITSRPLTISLSGGADMGAETVDATYAISAPLIQPIAAAYGVEAEGAVRATGRLTGSLSAPRLAGEASFTDLNFAGEPLGRAELEHDTIFAETLSGDLSLATDGSRFGAIAFDGAFDLTGDRLALQQMNLTGLGSSMSGDIDVDLAKTLADGALRVSVEDVAQIGAALNLKAAGSLDGRIALSQAEGLQQIDAALTAPEASALGYSLTAATLTATIADAFNQQTLSGDLRAQRVAGDGFQINGLEAEGEVRDVASTASADLQVGANLVRFGDAAAKGLSFRVGGSMSEARVIGTAASVEAVGASIQSIDLSASLAEIDRADPTVDAVVSYEVAEIDVAKLRAGRLAASGRLSNLSLNLATAGALPDETPLSFSSSARADLSGDSVAATVSELDLTIGALEFGVNAPLRVTSQGSTVALSGLDARLPAGGITGALTYQPDGLIGDLDLNIVDLGVWKDVLELPIDRGDVSVVAAFDTRRGPAKAEIQIAAQDIEFSDTLPNVGAVSVDASADWDGRRMATDTEISGQFGRPISLNVGIPLATDASGIPSVPPGGALSGRVTWAGDIGELWAVVPAPGHVLDGTSNIDLTIGGDLDNPTLSGDVSVKDGRYENLDIGMILVDLNVASKVTPDGALALDVSAYDGAGNPVSAKVELNNDMISAAVEAESAVLIRRDDITAAVSLNITAAGKLVSPTIAGEIIIDRAEARLVDATPPSVADLGPVEIKGAAPEEPKDDGLGGAPLDIKVRGDQDIFVRGRGLDSEWMIDLAIGGTTAAPTIGGAITARRGQLSLLGAPLDLARGEIRFFEKREPDPTLDILLERENDGVTGGIAVTGVASEPEISFVSQPTLPEGEVLPRILFGQSRQSLSPGQAASLALGMATLFDGSGGTLDSIRSTTGLDVLRIEDGERGPSVGVGSNVADGVFVGAKQPIDGGSASVQVEVEIFDEFTIDSETGRDTGSSIGLNWKRDF